MRTLIICQDNIGDLVFTSALAAALQTSGMDVGVLARGDTGTVARLMPGVTRVHEAPLLRSINPLTHWPRFQIFRRMRQELSAGGYDAAVLVGTQWRLGLLAAWAGIPMRVGYAHSKLRPYLTHKAPVPDRQQAVVPALMSLASAMGCPGTSRHYQLDATKVALRRARITPAGLPSAPWVGLHAFAGSEARCVTLEAWRGLAQWLQDQGWQVVWFGVSRELQRLRAMPDVPGLYCDQLGDGSLENTIGLLSMCQAYAGHDSGVLHLASAIGVRTLGVFAPGEPHRTFAQGPEGGETLYRPEPREITAQTLQEAFEHCFATNGRSSAGAPAARPQAGPNARPLADLIPAG